MSDTVSDDPRAQGLSPDQLWTPTYCTTSSETSPAVEQPRESPRLAGASVLALVACIPLRHRGTLDKL